MVRGVAQRVAVFLIGQFDDDAVHRVGQGLDFGQQLRPAAGQFGKSHRITDQVVIDQRQFGLLLFHRRNVLQSHDAGYCIARIFVMAAAFADDPGVELLEIVVADDDFAAGRPVERPAIIRRFQLDER